MGISYKSTFSAAAHVKRITEQKKKALDGAMESARAEIQTRTQKGKGADGDLKGYSDKKYYDSDGNRINFITKKGKVRPLETYKEYKLRKLGKDTVNLTETGNMLDAMQSKTELNENGILGKIFFLAQERKKAFWNQALRPNFFKLSREQLQTIVRKLKGK